MSVTSPFGLSVSFEIFQKIVRQALHGLNFHWVISDGAVNGIGRNGDILILPTPIPWSLSLLSSSDSDLRFLLGHTLTTPTQTTTPSLVKTSLKDEFRCLNQQSV